MATMERRRWSGDFSGPSRRDRQPCDYEVYIPDKLDGRRFSLDGDVAADVADAESAITRLDASAVALADSEALARLLLRAESVASSRIEGLVIGARRLLRTDAARRLGIEPRDVTAREILGNIDAMTWAVEAITPGTSITVDTLLETHRRLLTTPRMEKRAGRVREVQNWIGGSGYNPCSASFVPPPPELLDELLDDLVKFCNSDSLPVLAQAAVAHAQFETIHPFADGNGRTGRALIHMILRRRGLGLRILPPVSLILATRAQDYIDGLTQARYVGSVNSAAAHEGLNRWIGLFASACGRAVEDARRFEERVLELRSSWRERIGRIRRDSTVNILISVLPSSPVLTATTASELVGRSFPATGLAIERLVQAGILAQISVGRRNRAYEAPELIDAFTALERRLASPEGDTRVSAPARRVPERPFS
ncbi:MAG: Fic family protein [Chloroflexi bacterium]|nr:Fic family protein [Chloroflexota bacterium]